MLSETVAGWIVYDVENCVNSSPKLFFDVSSAIAYRKTLEDPIRWGITLQYIRPGQTDWKKPTAEKVCGLIPDTCYEVVLGNGHTIFEKDIIWFDSLSGMLNLAGSGGDWLGQAAPDSQLLASVELRKSHIYMLIFAHNSLELYRISGVEQALNRQLG